MTGYSRVNADGLTWELRSVNGRGLEVSFHLPRALSDLEPELRDIIRAQLSRGNVQASLEIKSSTVDASKEIENDAFEALIALESALSERCPQLRRPTTLDLLKWPGVVVKNGERRDPAVRERVRESLEKALQDLRLYREREGHGLEQAITDRLEAVSNLVLQIGKYARSQTDYVRSRLRRKLDQLNACVDLSRIEQEVALAANRADVTEELDRVLLHLTEFQNCLNGAGPHGRRLGFLTQELLRETNTLGAKTVVPECAPLTVDLKIAIDQIREQVANIE